MKNYLRLLYFLFSSFILLASESGQDEIELDFLSSAYDVQKDTLLSKSADKLFEAFATSDLMKNERLNGDLKSILARRWFVKNYSRLINLSKPARIPCSRGLSQLKFFNGNEIILAEGGKITTLDLVSHETKELINLKSNLSSVYILDNRDILAYYPNGQVFLWDKFKILKKQFNVKKEGDFACRISLLSGRKIISHHATGQLRIWSLDTGLQESEFNEHNIVVEDLEEGFDQNIITRDWCNVIKVWNLNELKSKMTLFGDGVKSFASSGLVVLDKKKQSLIIYDFNERNLKKEIQAQPNRKFCSLEAVFSNNDIVYFDDELDSNCFNRTRLKLISQLGEIKKDEDINGWWSREILDSGDIIVADPFGCVRALPADSDKFKCIIRRSRYFSKKMRFGMLRSIRVLPNWDFLVVFNKLALIWRVSELLKNSNNQVTNLSISSLDERLSRKYHN